jgi:hypothetical protein
MVDGWRIVKNFEVSSHGLIKVLFRHMPGGTEENKKKLSQDSRDPDWHSNQYESGASPPC